MPDSLSPSPSQAPPGVAPPVSDYLASLMQPSQEETTARKKTEAASDEAVAALKKGADQTNDYLAHLGNAPDPEKFGLGEKDLEAAKPSKGPEFKPSNPLKDFGGVASLIGIFGGMLTRKPLVTSLNAAAGAMNAYKQKNIEDYDKQVEEWKNNVDFIGKTIQWREQAYEMAAKQFSGNLSKLQAAQTAIAARSQDFLSMEQLQAGDYQRFYQTRMDTAKTLMQWQETQQRMQETADFHRNELQLQKDKLQAQTKGATLSDSAASKIAEQAIAGDRSGLQGLGYGNAGAANRALVQNKISDLMDERGITGADRARLNAEFTGVMASERAVGTRTAAMDIAANEVKSMAPLALSASKTVDRTQYPSLNSILLAAEKGTGDENVVRFGLAANSLIYMYAKFLNPNGIPTDADKAKATEILSTAWSKGQFEAAVDQIQKEIAVGQSALKTTKQELGSTLTDKNANQTPSGGGDNGGWKIEKVQ